MAELTGIDLIREENRKHDEFIKNLVVGQKIAIMGYSSPRLDEVVRITPTGRIKTKNGTQFDNTGREMGSSWHREYIMTDEEYNTWIANKSEKDKRRELIKEITNVNFEKLSLETLTELNNFMIKKGVKI